MKKPIILQQGAEAIITLQDNQILKNRISKSYRLKELDNKLRKLRTRSEARIMDRLSSVINVPKIIDVDEKNKLIIMEYIEGLKLSDNLENLNWREICKKIGDIISKLHNQDIIHGDLTTSNMILKNDNTSNLYNNKDLGLGSESGQVNERELGQVFFIDFGLSFHSLKLEDKAVDLHLLKQALEAKHFKIVDKAIEIIFDNYKAKRYREILERLKKVESRGRYKKRLNNLSKPN